MNVFLQILKLNPIREGVGKQSGQPYRMQDAECLILDDKGGGAPTTSTDTTTKSTVDNGSTGTSTTTTTVTHSDGSSTTTTSTCVTGTKGCTGATDDNQKDSFGGTCGAAFTCDGDAVQCAIAQEQQACCLARSPSRTHRSGDPPDRHGQRDAAAPVGRPAPSLRTHQEYATFA